jgi:hypothetical protein
LGEQLLEGCLVMTIEVIVIFISIKPAYSYPTGSLRKFTEEVVIFQAESEKRSPA